MIARFDLEVKMEYPHSINSPAIGTGDDCAAIGGAIIANDALVNERFLIVSKQIFLHF